MNVRVKIAVAVAALLALAGCGSGGSGSSTSSSTPPTSGSAPATAESSPSSATGSSDATVTESTDQTAPTESLGTIKVGFASATQPAYGTTLLADKTAERFTVEEVFFQNSELAMQGLLQGEVDVLAIGVNGPMLAIAQGADIKMFGVTIGNDWVLVTDNDIKSPADLEGKTVAIHSDVSTGTPLLKGTLSDAGVNANLVTIPGSPNRAQAMMSGQVDATVLFLSDALSLQRQGAGKFHVLLDYRDVPFASQALVASTSWLSENPDLAEAVLSHSVDTANKIKGDESWASGELASMFPDDDPEYLKSLVEEYVNRNLWVTDGGKALFSTLDVAIKTNKDLGTLPADASTDASDYVDLQFLQSLAN
jgi:ABC-type nitrate/sulfonate/bicarbonate transport system substrate-binding protein